METLEVAIIFSEEYVFGIHLHNDDPMVIVVKCDEFKSKEF